TEPRAVGPQDLRPTIVPPPALLRGRARGRLHARLLLRRPRIPWPRPGRPPGSGRDTARSNAGRALSRSAAARWQRRQPGRTLARPARALARAGLSGGLRFRALPRVAPHAVSCTRWI